MGVIGFPLSCRWCDQSLQDQPLEGRCPKCGRGIGETLEVQAIDTESLTVNVDVPCIGCRYNLRTLSIKGACPECNRALIESLSANRLCFADQDWLARLRQGVILLLSWLLGIGLSLGFLLLSTRSGGLGVVDFLGILLFVLAWPVWFLGVLLASVPPPSPSGEVVFPKSNLIAISCGVVFPILILVLIGSFRVIG